MTISIVNRTVFTTASPTSGEIATIPATTGGNTLVIMAFAQGTQAPAVAFLGAVQFADPWNRWGVGTFYLENIAAGQTQVKFGRTSFGDIVPAAAVIYELTPCTYVTGNSLNLTPTNPETGVTLNNSPGTFAYLEAIWQNSSSGSYDSVSSPWTFDYSVHPIPSGTNSMGSAVYILNTSGSQTPTWNLTPGSGATHCGIVGLVMQDAGVAPVPCPIVSGGVTVGVNISDLSLNIAPATELYHSFLATSAIEPTETVIEGRNAVILDLNAGNGVYSRDIETVFSWPMTARIALRVWQPSYIPLPENTFNRAEDWDDGGTLGNKFIQGVIIEADTGGLPKSFQLQSADDLTVNNLNEIPAVFATQTTKAFSCVTPFIAHAARLVSNDGVSWRTFKNKIVFKPWPELTMNWQTEQTSFGLTGWLHAREMNIAYCSTSPVTVTLVFDSWPTQIYTLPATGGLLVQAKQKITLQTNKFKLVSVQCFCTTPMYLFQNDMEFKVKAWGSTDAFQVLKVVGGPSDTGAVV